MLENSKNDLKKSWKIINNLLSKNIKTKEINIIICNNCTYTSNADIANAFNNFFCSIGLDYDSKIPCSELNPCHYINVNHRSYFFLEPVSPFEVEYHIKNLKNSKQNIDSIPTSLFKEYHEMFSHVIADLINKCFQTGVFPKSLKKSYCFTPFEKGKS